MKLQLIFTGIALFVLSGTGSFAKTPESTGKAHKTGDHNHLHRHANQVHNHIHTHIKMHKKHSYTHHHDPEQHDQEQNEERRSDFKDRDE